MLTSLSASSIPALSAATGKHVSRVHNDPIPLDLAEARFAFVGKRYPMRHRCPPRQSDSNAPTAILCRLTFPCNRPALFNCTDSALLRCYDPVPPWSQCADGEKGRKDVCSRCKEKHHVPTSCALLDGTCIGNQQGSGTLCCIKKTRIAGGVL